MPEFTIRPVTPPDIPAIAALAREAWQASYPGIITQAQIDFMLEQRYNYPQLMADLQDPGKWLDQAFAGDRRAGFAACEIYQGEYKLDKLYIHPESQRQGAGGALIDHAIARARELGYPCVILAVNKHNEPALSAYRKYGFSVRAAVTSDIGDGFIMDDYIMERRTAVSPGHSPPIPGTSAAGRRKSAP
ncbi:MAG: GNAT family N-acetyltransferase [Zoogloeaceae bacterium]|jgi:ribosomal protein S18 acetylase RimI-like enzyme|nr:GNAT family N-acetyltransferase [Zoogloeaceae bacterium]